MQRSLAGEGTAGKNDRHRTACPCRAEIHCRPEGRCLPHFAPQTPAKQSCPYSMIASFHCGVPRFIQNLDWQPLPGLVLASLSKAEAMHPWSPASC